MLAGIDTVDIETVLALSGLGAMLYAGISYARERIKKRR